MGYAHSAFIRFRWLLCVGACGVATLLAAGFEGFDLFPFLYGIGLQACLLMLVWYVCRTATGGLVGLVPTTARHPVLRSPLGVALLAEAVCLLAMLLLLVALNFGNSGPGFSMSVGGQEIVAKGQLTEAGLRLRIFALIGQVLTLAAITILSTAGLLILASPKDTPEEA